MYYEELCQFFGPTSKGGQILDKVVSFILHDASPIVKNLYPQII